MTVVKERYEVLETLGAGGEARVVKALDRQHERVVALKIRRVRDAVTRDELLGEARVLLAIPPHPALPLVREDFFDGDDYIVAMDWVDGTDLATLLAQRGDPGLAPSSVLAYLAQAAEALAHLHSQTPPVIHGDVKPGNLILSRGGRVKLVDFGLSSAPGAPLRRSGTPGYRAPELAAGGTPSRAGDVYGLAATAFALLTGAPPAGVLPTWDGIDPAQADQLESAIRLGMSTDPARRPATAGELVERLRAGWAEGLPAGVVTFCFSDIEGSTALWADRPEAMAEAQVRHDELIAGAAAAHGGSVIHSMGEGDSTVSVFDSATHAVAAALDANRLLAAEDWPVGIGIRVRWGLHTGEAERRGSSYTGPTIIVAARVRSQADGGQIFLSSVTSELVAAHLPAGCSLVDLGPHRLKGIGAPERIWALKGPGVETPPPATECPYRGLLSFEAGDRDFFFGREDVVATLVARLAPGRLLALVGASGSGKSSVLRAGVVAAVLAGEVPGIDDVTLLTPGSEPALDVPDRPNHLVVVDQFEELFTVCEDRGRREDFIDAVLGLESAVAIGVRADLYGRLSGHGDLARAVADNHVLLGAMSGEELERAVARPAALAGLRLEHGLVELTLRDVAAEPGALPLLSHALHATWERRDGRTLTVDGYRATGGVASAIARTADSVVDTLPDAQRRVVRGVYVRMTELGEGVADSRRRVPVADLVPEGAAPEAVEGLLERLAEARLVTLDQGTAEVAHEALIREWPTLRGWLDEDRAGVRAHRELGQAALRWDADAREASDLYRGARLASAVDLARSGRAELNVLERAFLDASIEDAERERRAQLRANRRLRGLLAGAAALLVVAIAAGIVAIGQRNNARVASSNAEGQALTSDAERLGALAQSAPTLERRMLLAVAGVKLQDRVATRSDLLQVLQENPAAVRILRPAQHLVTAIGVSRDGRLLAAGDDRGALRLIDTRSWRQTGDAVQLGDPVAPQAISFASGGATVAVGTLREGRFALHLVDVRGHGSRRIGSWSDHGILTPALPMSVAFAPDGRHIALALASFSAGVPTPVGQRLLMVDSASGRTAWQMRLPVPRGQLEMHVLWSPSGDLITSAGQASPRQAGTQLRDVRTGRVVRRFATGGPVALAPDGHTLAVGVNSANPSVQNSMIDVLDLRTGHRRRLGAAIPDGWVGRLEFTHDGSHLMGAGTSGVHVWDLGTGAISESFAPRSVGPDDGVAVDRRDRLFTGGDDGSITVWDIGGEHRLGHRFRWTTPYRGCANWPCAVANPQGTLLAAEQGDGTAALVDLRTHRRIAELPARNGPVAPAMAFSADGRTLATGGSNGTVAFWDTRSQALVRTVRFGVPVGAVAVSPDRRLVAALLEFPGDRRTRIDVREIDGGRRLYSHTIPHGSGDVRFTPDGRVLIAASCCYRGSAVVGWEPRTGTVRFERASSTRNVSAIAVSPDSRLLATGTGEGQVQVWNARTGRPTAPAFRAANSIIGQLAFSPDGDLLAAGSNDLSATLWDVSTREQLGTHFPIAPNTVPGVLFEPDGRLLISELGDAVEWPTDRRTLARFACQVAGRDLTRGEWRDLVPNRPYRLACP